MTLRSTIGSRSRIRHWWKESLCAAIVAVSVLGLAGCAADGGGRGSGVSSVHGNVVRIQVAQRKPEAHPAAPLLVLWRELFSVAVANARSEVEGIRVFVEGTDFQGVTDANGFFSVTGIFEGPVALIFQRPDDGVTARLPVTVPAGGVVTANDVEIDNRDGTARAASKTVRFEGRVAARECEASRLHVVSRDDGDGGPSYPVEVDGSLRDEAGNPVDCEQVEEGRAIDIEGFVEEDETIEATNATVREEKPRREERNEPPGQGGAGEVTPATPTPTPTFTPTPSPTPPPTAPPTPTPTPRPGMGQARGPQGNSRSS